MRVDEFGHLISEIRQIASTRLLVAKLRNCEGQARRGCPYITRGGRTRTIRVLDL